MCGGALSQKGRRPPQELRRMFAQNGHNIVSNLQKAATNVEPFIRTSAADAQLAFTQ